jgi:hypothetical protein
VADIIITCNQCGNTITVSEFVTAESLTCIKCKAKVLIPPQRTTPAAGVPKLRLAAQVPVADPAGQPGAPGSPMDPDVRQHLPKMLTRSRQRKVTQFQVRTLPWLLFFLLAAALACLRYWPQILAPDLLQTTILAGIWTLLFLHLSVACYAFSDEAFYGVLCLIIPGYTIYYLFFQSDKMFLRAVVGSLLIAFGWDAVLASRELWAEVYTTISIWIATTDTIKK